MNNTAKQILFTACMAWIATLVFLGGRALFLHMVARGRSGWEEVLIAGAFAFVATLVFLGGHVLFFRTKTGKAYRRKLGQLIAGPEWGK